MNLITPDSIESAGTDHARTDALQARVTLRSRDQLETLYRRGLSTGEMYLPMEQRAALGAAIELQVSLGDEVSITLRARVAADAPDDKPGVMIRFAPMSPSEYQAISSLLRETEAVRSPRLASGTERNLATVPRATETFTEVQQRIVQRELVLAHGRDALADGRLQEAAACFETVLATAPGCVDAITGLAEVAARRRDAMRGRLAELLRRR